MGPRFWMEGSRLTPILPRHSRGYMRSLHVKRERWGTGLLEYERAWLGEVEGKGLEETA
jgi:hypothetical protein